MGRDFVVGDRVQLVAPRLAFANTHRAHAKAIKHEAERRVRLGLVKAKRGWVVKTAVVNKAVKFAVRVDGVEHREWFHAHEIELVNPLERLAEEAAKNDQEGEAHAGHHQPDLR